jgi:hypothetical protein
MHIPTLQTRKYEIFIFLRAELSIEVSSFEFVVAADNCCLVFYYGVLLQNAKWAMMTLMWNLK